MYTGPERVAFSNKFSAGTISPQFNQQWTGQVLTAQHKSIAELEADIMRLSYAMGTVLSAIVDHKFDIEDEAYEVLISKVIEINANVLDTL